MAAFPPKLQELIRAFSNLPSVGEKSATRIALALVTSQRQKALQLKNVLEESLQAISLCPTCFFLCEKEVCPICSDATRDTSQICIVEKPSDLVAIERLREYRGMYHVLHGVWAPLKGAGPESMRVAELVARLERATDAERPVREIIIATSSTVEGEATALFIADVLKRFALSITRLAQGMSRGGELEYADDFTLSRAFAGRSALK